MKGARNEYPWFCFCEKVGGLETVSKYKGRFHFVLTFFPFFFFRQSNEQLKAVFNLVFGSVPES